MIEFTCIYCGNSVQAEESTTYRRVKCPACGHSIAVRNRKIGSALRCSRDSSTDTPDADKDWEHMSDEQIAEKLLSRTLDTNESDKNAAKMLLSPLIPKYDDLRLFALSLAFLLLVLIDGQLRQDVIKAFTGELGPRVTVLFLFACFGMACSLVNIFLQREKSELEKRAMLLFAILVTGGTGIYTGWLMLNQSRGWLMIFPAWNIINGFLLLLLMRAGIIDTECIISRKAAFGQIVVTAVAIPILLTSCLYLLELHWAPTFSIVTVYTMNLHGALGHLLEPKG